MGSGSSAGGLSLDDINLSETTCPEFMWRVKNFSHVMDTTPPDTAIYSPPFTSKEGYTFQMTLYPSGKAGYPGELSAYANLVARTGDTGQQWPCPWKQITMMLMDQHPHIQKRMSNQRSITTDPNRKTSGLAIFCVKKKTFQIFTCCICSNTVFLHPFKQTQVSFSGTILERLVLRSQM